MIILIHKCFAFPLFCAGQNLKLHFHPPLSSPFGDVGHSLARSLARFVCVLCAPLVRLSVRVFVHCACTFFIEIVHNLARLFVCSTVLLGVELLSSPIRFAWPLCAARAAVSAKRKSNGNGNVSKLVGEHRNLCAVLGNVEFFLLTSLTETQTDRQPNSRADRQAGAQAHSGKCLCWFFKWRKLLNLTQTRTHTGRHRQAYVL